MKTLYCNADIITCDPENMTTYKHMVVDGKNIVWLGNDIPNDYKHLPVVDLEGRCVVPAFVDTHMHFASFSMIETTFNIENVKNFQEAASIVQDYNRSHPKQKVLLGFGCSAHTVEEKRLPEKSDLDKWTDKPLVIIKYDGHAAVLNSAALRILSREVLEDPGCDPDSGWIYQHAFYRGVNEMSAKFDRSMIIKSLTHGASALVSAGIGLAHVVEGVGFPKDMDVDLLRYMSPGLPSNFRIYFQTMEVEKVLKRKMSRIGGCFSLALDGCFGSEDAALLEPYTNNPENSGMLCYSQEQVNDFAIKANRAHLQITMHAIGDAAVEQCIRAYEAALEDYPRQDHRHIMIHASLIHEDQLERMAKLGLCIATQTSMLYWDQEPEEYLRKVLGERVDQLSPLRTMVDLGIVVADGSDAPCTRPNPLWGMHCSVNHPNPEQALTRMEALMMRTYNGAYLSFDEQERGSITVSKLADFVVLDENPLTVPAAHIKDIRVESLYLDGYKVSSKPIGLPTLLTRALTGRSRAKP